MRSTIEVTRSVQSAFVTGYGMALADTVDSGLMDRLASALASNSLGQAFGLPPSKAQSTGYRSRLSSLVASYEALSCVSFANALRESISNAGLSHSEIVSACGITPNQLSAWLDTGGMSVITPSQAMLLDKVLQGDGWLLDRYVALSQLPADKVEACAMDLVLDQESFRGLLLAGRQQLGMQPAEVAAWVTRTLAANRALADQRAKRSVNPYAQDHKRVLTPSLLSYWERGFSVASRQCEAIVAALDQLYGLQGKLVSVWEAEEPRQLLSAYSLRFSFWCPRLQEQFRMLARYKRTNSMGWDRSDCRTGDRWTGEASEAKVLEDLERFFGFLITRGIPPEQHSLSLLANWDLVEGFLEFVRDRVQRSTFSADAISIAQAVLNTICFVLPHLEMDVAAELYWRGRLPLERIDRREVAAGVFQETRRPLAGVPGQWAAQIDLAHKRGRAFLREGDFQVGSLAGRARPLMDLDNVLAELSEILRALVQNLPLRIDSDEAAVHCRRVTAAVILLARSFRPGNLRRLKLTQVLIEPDGRVRFRIPPSDFKCRGRGGSAEGFDGVFSLEDYAHDAVNRYIREARPRLLGGMGASAADQGYLLTALPIHNQKGDRMSPGRPLTGDVLRRDIRHILGYHPYGERFLCGTQAALRGISHQETTGVLGNTLTMLETVYSVLPQRAQNRRVNCLLDQLVSDPDA